MRPFARRFRTIICATSALGLVAFAPAAFAQEDPGASSDDSNEIIVTARRRDERRIDVPIAGTAISGDALATAGAIDITADAAITPNTALGNTHGTTSTLTPLTPARAHEPHFSESA